MFLLWCLKMVWRQKLTQVRQKLSNMFWTIFLYKQHLKLIHRPSLTREVGSVSKAISLWWKVQTKNQLQSFVYRLVSLCHCFHDRSADVPVSNETRPRTCKPSIRHCETVWNSGSHSARNETRQSNSWKWRVRVSIALEFDSPLNKFTFVWYLKTNIIVTINS